MKPHQPPIIAQSTVERRTVLGWLRGVSFPGGSEWQLGVAASGGGGGTTKGLHLLWGGSTAA